MGFTSEPSPCNPGNVILGQGNIKLKAGYVEIKNSTKVPLGTALKIGN
jgi:lipopolysaccharide export system protein LptA